MNLKKSKQKSFSKKQLQENKPQLRSTAAPGRVIKIPNLFLVDLDLIFLSRNNKI